MVPVVVYVVVWGGCNLLISARIESFVFQTMVLKIRIREGGPKVLLVPMPPSNSHFLHHSLKNKTFYSGADQ